jgi:hypothetical protein
MAKEIMNTLPDNPEGVRLLGITLTGLAPITFENIALDLFEHEQRRKYRDS